MFNCSKKDPEKRREELKKAIAQPLTQLIVNNIADFYRNNAFCLFTVTILKHIVGKFLLLIFSQIHYLERVM